MKINELLETTDELSTSLSPYIKQFDHKSASSDGSPARTGTTKTAQKGFSGKSRGENREDKIRLAKRAKEIEKQWNDIKRMNQRSAPPGLINQEIARLAKIRSDKTLVGRLQKLFKSWWADDNVDDKEKKRMANTIKSTDLNKFLYVPYDDQGRKEKKKKSQANTLRLGHLNTKAFKDHYGTIAKKAGDLGSELLKSAGGLKG